MELRGSISIPCVKQKSNQNLVELATVFGSLTFIGGGRYPGKPGKTAPTVQTAGFLAAGGDCYEMTFVKT